MAVFRIEKTRDYTVMANHHLKNKALSLKAKGLLSVMLSLPDDWDYTLKGLAFISKESIDAIREGIRELETAGYIVRSRSRNDKGQLTGAGYVIYEHPHPVSENATQAGDTPPAPNQKESSKPSPVSANPTLEEPTLENPTQDNPTLGNPTQLNTNVIKTHPAKTYPENKNPINNIRPSCPSMLHSGRNDDGQTDEIDDIGDLITDFESHIKTKISYQDFWDAQPNDMNLINEIIAVMVDVLVTPGEYVTVGGEKKPRELVASRLLWKLDYRHVGHVVEQFKSVTTPIKKKRQYLLTMLYNATMEIDAHYTNAVMSDTLDDLNF